MEFSSSTRVYLYIGFDGKRPGKPPAIPNFQPQSAQTRPGRSCVTFIPRPTTCLDFFKWPYLATERAKVFSDPQWTVKVGQGLLWHGARFSIVSKTVSWQ
ncbi:hypothetical protein JTE90_016147, partial [Oedothorax gibbosus]